MRIKSAIAAIMIIRFVFFKLRLISLIKFLIHLVLIFSDCNILPV